MGCHQSPVSHSDTLIRSSLNACATTGVSSPCQLGSGGAGPLSGFAGAGLLRLRGTVYLQSKSGKKYS